MPDRETGLAPGDLVTVNWDDDGTFRVAKILVTEPAGVHVRVFAERFDERPGEVPEKLTLGTPTGESFGVGHMPLAWQEFELWQPEHLGSSTVTEDDLDGYEVWHEAAAEGQAGFFGSPEPPKRTLWDRLRRR